MDQIETTEQNTNQMLGNTYEMDSLEIKPNLKEQVSEAMGVFDESQKTEEFLETLEDARKLRENTRTNMVQILNQGHQLKLDIRNLKEDFQSLLNGVSEFGSPEYTTPPESRTSEKSQIIRNTITEAVDEYIDVIGPSEKYDISPQSSIANLSNDLRKSSKLQVTFAEDCVDLENSPAPAVTKSDRALKSHRRHSAQLPQSHVSSASKISSQRAHKSRRHSSAISTDRRRKQLSESDENTEVPKYQTLKVSDTPSFETQTRVRAIYKNHKRRLMARRESGDGAPCEGTPTKYVRLSAVQNPVQSLISPMRRLPIRERTSVGQSPYGQIDTQNVASIWRRSQSHTTKRYDDNGDRLKPKFLSMRNAGRSNSVESPVDPLSLPRPSPEGLYNSPAAQRCACRRSSCDEFSIGYSHEHQQVSDMYQFRQPAVPQNPPQPKKLNKYSRRQFPKTPKAQRDMKYPLETIDENGLVHIVMTPEHYNRHLQQIAQAKQVNALQRQCAATSSLPGISSQHVRKTTTNIRDISQISHISSSMHEQPSNIHVQGDFHSTFQYPLHSTMSYPLSSTMRNNSLVLEDANELSSINVESALTPVKNNQKSTARKSSSNVGVNTNDLRSTVDMKNYIDNIVAKTQPKFENHKSNQFEVPKTVNAETPKSAKIEKELVSYPQTPSEVVNSFYKLSYESDGQDVPNEDCPSADVSTDCDSSFISIDTDFPPRANNFQQEVPVATPTNNACQHAGTVTCRCHLKTVKRIHYFDNMRNDEVRTLFDQRPVPVGFSESTVFMDSHLREIYPMDVDAAPARQIATKDNLSAKQNVDQNNSNTSNDSGKSIADGRGHSDFISNMCNSIESITDVENDSVPRSSAKSSANSLKTVVEIKPLSKKPPMSKTQRRDQEIMAQTHIETNCLNLAKLMTAKETKDTIMANRALAANANVTMVADGCLGFLRKKKASSAKKDKKAAKSRKFSLRGSKIKPDFAENFDDEDKENAPRAAFRPVPVVHNVQKPFQYGSDGSDRASVVSTSIADGCIGHEMKRKLSKRMKEFRRSAMSESGRMHQQSFGHI